MEAEVLEPKKKRGRPRKKVDELSAPVVVTPEDEAQDKELLAQIESECPYQKDENGNYGLAGRGWIDDEFAKRKKELKQKTVLVKVKPEEDPAFVSEAKKSDKRIDKALQKGSESFFEAVKELVASGENKYYKALGFKSFDKYRETKTEYSRSYILDGMKAYKELHGKIEDERLMALPVPTALLLTRVPESKLNEALTAAESMTIHEFKEKEFPKYASQLVDGTTGEPQPIQPEEFDWIPRMRVHKQVADIWKRFMEIARWKAVGLVDENDVYGNFSLEEKSLLCVYFECAKSSGWEAEYEEAKFPAATKELTTEVDEQPAF